MDEAGKKGSSWLPDGQLRNKVKTRPGGLLLMLVCFNPWIYCRLVHSHLWHEHRQLPHNTYNYSSSSDSSNIKSNLLGRLPCLCSLTMKSVSLFTTFSEFVNQIDISLMVISSLWVNSKLVPGIQIDVCLEKAQIPLTLDSQAKGKAN